MIIIDSTKIDRALAHKYLSVNIGRRKVAVWILLILSFISLCIYGLNSAQYIQIVPRGNGDIFFLIFMIMQAYVNYILQSIRFAEFFRAFAKESDAVDK